MRSATCALFFLTMLLASAGAHAVTLFADEFDQDTLNPGWQVTQVSGVDLLLTAQPGKLVIKNQGKTTSVEAANAARLALDAPSGDFTIETQVTDERGGDGPDEEGPALYVTFRGRDTLAWIYANYLSLDDTNAGTLDQGTRMDPPVFMRMRRVANNFIFEAKQHAADKWTGMKQVILDDTPVKIGLMFPAGQGYSYSAVLGYFHFDAPGPDGPPPTLSGLSATTINPGAVLLLSGHDFTPGSSIVLVDGSPVPAIFSTTSQGLVQIPLNTAVGSHTVAVETGAKTSAPQTFTTATVDAVLSAIMIGGGKLGDANGDGVVDLKDATIVLRLAVGLM